MSISETALHGRVYGLMILASSLNPILLNNSKGIVQLKVHRHYLLQSGFINFGPVLARFLTQKTQKATHKLRISG